MDKGNLKTYAPQARRDFIEMVISRAAQLGIVEQNGILSVADILVQGEVAIVAGQAFPAAIANLRKSLIERMRTDGFTATVEAIAYSWFNRFAALRYMELHGYLDHGHRVLSSVTPKGMPDILTHGLELAESGALPGINHNEVAELKIAGRDGELYKQLLVAQCNKLSTSMPFLFEKIDDDSELLLPDNLLRTDSVIRKLVEGIAEEDWSHVEIIGWLYQFYISEKKDQVMGKVVKSDDIPAATQLFTPNWIVKYLVQNSIGRIWLQANPSSSLAKQMSFYTATSNQTPQAQAQIDALTHMRIAEDGDVLNPETISVLDPACGSGHILVEAYDLLKAIYLERGYRNRDIPRKILQHNLFGLDIDDRAAQMAGFALTMKARADDRRILDEPLVLNITALRNFHGADLDSVAETVIQAAAQIDGSAPLSEGQLFGGGTPSSLHTSGITSNDVCALIRSLSQSKVVGSLITLPTSVVAKLPVLMNVLHQVIGKGDDLSKSYAEQIYKEFVRPAQILSRTYDVVVANPPYMGSNGMNPTVKDFAKKHFPNTKSDLFAMFMERGFSWCKPSGINSMVTMQSWMFLSSYSALRKMILDKYSILSLMQIGYNSFPEMNSKIAQACAFSIGAAKFSDHSGCYVNLNSAPQSADKEQVFLNRSDDLVFEVDQSEFSKISGIPIAYWASAKLRECFSSLPGLGVVAETKQGLATTNNSLFLRQWYETDFTKIGFSIQDNDAAYKSGKKWFPLNKGGGFRRWYGNHEYTINFEKGGAAICEYIDSTPGVNVKSNGRVINRDSYFKEGLTWSSLTSAGFSMRYSPGGFIFETKGSMCFPNEKADTFELLAIFNSKLVDHFLQCLSPTLDYHEGPIKLVPTKLGSNKEIVENVREAISIAKLDWDSNETSWDFKSLPTVSSEYRQVKLSQSWSTWNRVANSHIDRMRVIEERNNELLIKEYGLCDELSPEISLDQISLTKADRKEDMVCLVSFSIGCMMGRYSISEPGIIYGAAGNIGFDANRYGSFQADYDGILPITDVAWFPDDATSRIKEFIGEVWGYNSVDENMKWLAESLDEKSTSNSEATIRSYISNKFYKDHLQTYRRRPIYWLFSSGKQKAFEALVYLHRYNEGTLSRMRAEYVSPLSSKLTDRIRLLEEDSFKAVSSVNRKKIDKDIDRLKKKLEELRLFDEKLRHYADLRIKLDLDDGVRVNYGKFGDLLAEVKAVTGGDSDE